MHTRALRRRQLGRYHAVSRCTTHGCARHAVRIGAQTAMTLWTCNVTAKLLVNRVKISLTTLTLTLSAFFSFSLALYRTELIDLTFPAVVPEVIYITGYLLYFYAAVVQASTEKMKSKPEETTTKGIH